MGIVVSGASSPIRVAVEEYQGVERLDIRYQYMGDDGELKPTKRGISIPLELAYEVYDAIKLVLEIE